MISLTTLQIRDDEKLIAEYQTVKRAYTMFNSGYIRGQ